MKRSEIAVKWSDVLGANVLLLTLREKFITMLFPVLSFLLPVLAVVYISLDPFESCG